MTMSCNSFRPIKPSVPLAAHVVPELRNPYLATYSVVFQSTRASAVAISCEAEKPALFLTAAHVVHGISKMIGIPNAPILLKGSGGFMIARAIKIDEKADLALLKTMHIVKNGCVSVSIANSHPFLGERVFAVSSPKGFDKYITSGVISKYILNPFNKKFYMTDIVIHRGSSGGGVYNTRGELVAIVSSMVAEDLRINIGIGILVLEKKYDGLGNIVSVFEIQKFLEKQ